MTEHSCGPTPAQVRDACLRGDNFGTWERCPECAERERLLWERIGPHVFIVPPCPSDDLLCHCPGGSHRIDFKPLL